MKKIIALLCLLLSATQVFAANVNIDGLPAASSVGRSDLFECEQSNINNKCTASQVGAFANGVFNVRTMYGAVPDGSTSNNTAISNAFAAAAAYSHSSGDLAHGIATVYFDCDTTTTTCVYNYGGSGTSPMNMVSQMSLLCAPGVTLNYTGTAHAVEIGNPSFAGTLDEGHFLIQGCRFTGGANYTGGLYVHPKTDEVAIFDNVFYDFGNQTAASIVVTGFTFRMIVSRNFWRDDDGLAKNMFDAHTATNNDVLFADNRDECVPTPYPGQCSVVSNGYGVWLFSGQIMRNQFTFHYPAIRLSSCQACGGGSGVMIDQNYFEGNFYGPTMVTYGDPGTAGNIHIQNIRFRQNWAFLPVPNGTDAFIGPEAASSSQFFLDLQQFTGNEINVTRQSGTGLIINTNGGSGHSYFAGNYSNGTKLDQSTSPSWIDSAQLTSNYWAVSSFGSSAAAQSNRVPAFGSDGVNLGIASFHNMSTPILCSDSSGSGTAKTCDTSPKFDVTGSTFTPAAGDCFTLTSTTGVTGSATLAINGTTAATMKKTGGTANLANGDTKAGGYYPVCFDGTSYQITLGQ